jgi:hypothetical protein
VKLADQPSEGAVAFDHLVRLAVIGNQITEPPSQMARSVAAS